MPTPSAAPPSPPALPRDVLAASGPVEPGLPPDERRGPPEPWTWHSVVGYVLLALNAILYGWTAVTADAFSSGIANGLPPVLVAVVVTHAYGLSLGISSRRSRSHRAAQRPRRARRHGSLYLANLLVCAFTLDFDASMFSPFPGWFVALAALSVVVPAVYPLWDRLSANLRWTWAFAAGLSLVTYAHAAAFLAPLAPFGVMGSVVLGVGVLLLVPALAIVSVGVAIRREVRANAFLRRPALLGVAVPLAALTLAAGGYGVATYGLRADLRDLAQLPLDEQGPQIVELLTRSDADHLGWIAVGDGRHSEDFMGWDAIDRWRPSAEATHNPLILWATALFPTPEFSPDTEIALWRAFAPDDHDLEERLRRGRTLATSRVAVTHRVDEATATARSRYEFEVASANRSRFAFEEAIYTLTLPAGAVVTGSSLIVDGVEQPGRLTTKGRARAAYRRIVGAERRDPQLVEWRDGDRVAVRVFPVRNDAPRTFSLEVVSPLVREGADGVFAVREVTVEGPAAGAAEVRRELLIGGRSDVSVAGGYVGGELAIRTLRWPTPGGEGEAYVREGYAYRVVAPPTPRPTELAAVHLDLTDAWSRAEVDALRRAAEGGGVTVYAPLAGEPVVLTDDNSGAALAEAAGRRRSLYPVERIADPGRALLLTKPVRDGFALRLFDLAERRDALVVWLDAHAAEAPLAVAELAPGTTAPYLASLAACGAATLERVGGAESVAASLAGGHYPRRAIDPELVTLSPDHAVAREPTDRADGGGDPAALQLYNARRAVEAARAAFPDSTVQASAMAFARAANAVTPWSSLVVLETDADYVRFGIPNVIGPDGAAPPAGTPGITAIRDDDEEAVAEAEALGNSVVGDIDPDAGLEAAFAIGDGSVPEPHEWALLALGLLTLTGLWLKRT